MTNDSPTKTWKPRPPADEVHEGLKRWCGWPGCREWHVAMYVHEPGWIFAARKAMYLCPLHAESGHLPSFTYDRAQKVTTATCSCGWSEIPPGTSFNHVRTVWTRHVSDR